MIGEMTAFAGHRETCRFEVAPEWRGCRAAHGRWRSSSGVRRPERVVTRCLLEGKPRNPEWRGNDEKERALPQIIVTADRGGSFGEGAITFRERVNVEDFESRHFADQLVERIGWAVGDADEVERVDHRDGTRVDRQ